MILSNGWNLQLEDIRGAFQEADALDRRQRPLYSSLPPGEIRGVPGGSVIMILGNCDAPQRWWMKFDADMTSIGFAQSTFDVCVYLLRNSAVNIEGILCVHVDNTICGGSGSLFTTALTELRRRSLSERGNLVKACFAVRSMCKTNQQRRS